jgi:membrane protein DedA with SNARE-associated domain
LIVALAAAAAMIMDTVWYTAGARGSERILRFYRRLTGSSGTRDDPVLDYFARYGAATIVIGRFFTSVRAVAWPGAASQGVGYVKFFVLDFVAATAWASLWVLLGWIVGERWQAAADTAGLWLAAASVVVLAVAVVPLMSRLRKRRRARRSPARRRS